MVDYTTSKFKLEFFIRYGYYDVVNCQKRLLLKLCFDNAMNIETINQRKYRLFNITFVIFCHFFPSMGYVMVFFLIFVACDSFIGIDQFFELYESNSHFFQSGCVVHIIIIIIHLLDYCFQMKIN